MSSSHLLFWCSPGCAFASDSNADRTHDQHSCPSHAASCDKLCHSYRKTSGRERQPFHCWRSVIVEPQCTLVRGLKVSERDARLHPSSVVLNTIQQHGLGTRLRSVSTSGDWPGTHCRRQGSPARPLLQGVHVRVLESKPRAVPGWPRRGQQSPAPRCKAGVMVPVTLASARRCHDSNYHPAPSAGHACPLLPPLY